MKQELLLARLTQMREPLYAEFSSKLKVSKRPILGVRAPHLSSLAKTFAKEEGVLFLDDFFLYPAFCYEEVLLAYKLFGLLKLDIPTTTTYLEKLLGYNESWATNDTLCSSFKAPKSAQAPYWPIIIRYLDSYNPWDIRFATIAMMTHYLNDEYTPQVLELLAGVESDHYYVQMGLAWAFATALAKQRETTLAYFSEGILSETVRKKAIQKCIESFRIGEEDKNLLRAMR